MEKWIYLKDNDVKMISDGKLQSHGNMKEVKIEISDVDFKKVSNDNFSMKFNGKSLVFEAVVNKEMIKEELKNADTVEKLNQVIQKIIN